MTEQTRAEKRPGEDLIIGLKKQLKSKAKEALDSESGTLSGHFRGLFESVQALGQHVGADLRAIQERVQKKAAERGAFEKGFMLKIDGEHGEEWKLVRDGIPAIMRAEGKEPETKQVAGEELRVALRRKLQEEIREALNATEPEKLLEELADIFQVMLSLGFKWPDATQEKAE